MTFFAIYPKDFAVISDDLFLTEKPPFHRWTISCLATPFGSAAPFGSDARGVSPPPPLYATASDG